MRLHLALLGSVGAVVGAMVGALSLSCAGANLAVSSDRDSKSLPLNGTFVLAQNETLLLGAGDISTCEDDDDDKTAVLVESWLNTAGSSARAFTAGDNVYPSGTEAQFEKCYLPTWGRFRDRTLAVPGNHDWRTAKASGFRQALAPQLPLGQYWRSVDVGGTHVILLDSDCDEIGGCGPGSPQYTWLERDLAQNPHPCAIAIWHHPLFSSGPHGGDERMRATWALLDQHGVDAVIAGHDHVYERFVDKHSDGSAGGMFSFVVGTGGATAYPLGPQAAGSVARFQGVPGVLALALGENGLRFAMLGTDGRIHDSGQLTCR